MWDFQGEYSTQVCIASRLIWTCHRGDIGIKRMRMAGTGAERYGLDMESDGIYSAKGMGMDKVVGLQEAARVGFTERTIT
jgi:hypothetical protein